MDNSQNQNKKNIPGTFTTMKDDVANAKLSPEERLQRAGSFAVDESPAAPESVEVTGFDSKNPSMQPEKSFAAPPSVDNPVQEEKAGALSGFSFDDDEPAKASSQPSKGLDFSQLDDDEFRTPEPKSTPPVGASTTSKDVSFDDIFDSADSNASFGDAGSIQPESDSFTFDDEPPVKKKKKSKAPVIVGGVLMLLILVGVSVYALDSQLNLFGPPATPQPVDDLDFSDTDDTDLGTGDTDPTPIDTDPVDTDPQDTFVPGSGTPIVVADASETVTIGENNIRTDILNQITGSSSNLIEVTLAGSDGLPLSFEQFQEALGIRTPGVLSDSVTDYWVYAYNQDGIFKMGTVLQIEPSLSTDQVVVDWLSTVPQDLSGFSLSSSSRSAAGDAAMRSSEVTTPGGRTLTNYFYNYTEPTNSIDITYVDSYIVMASSQLSMEALINSFDL